MSYAQSFKNLNLSQLCNVPPTFDDFDPFYVGLNNQFCTLPWELSHGTPQIQPQGALSNIVNTILLASGKDSEGSLWNEGVFYRHKFLKNRVYKLRFNFSAETNGLGTSGIVENPTDEFSVYFANGLSSVNTTSNQTTSLNNRSYATPAISSKQRIFFKEDVIGQQPIFEQTVIPDNDYDFLWFTVKDDEKVKVITGSQGQVTNPSAGAAILYVWNIDIPCDASINDVIIDKNDVTISTYYLHTALGSMTQGNKISIPCINGPVIVKNATGGVRNNRTGEYFPFLPDPPVIMEAQKEVTILSPPNASSKYFEVERGKVFEARINPDICIKDICGKFVPWDRNRVLVARNVVQLPVGSGLPFLIKSFGYQSPYNAYAFDLRIYNRWGGDFTPDEGSKRFEKTFEDRINGIPNDEYITWDGSGSIGGSQTYLWVLKLTNCESTIEYKGTILASYLTNPNDSIQEVQYLKSNTINNPLNSSYQVKKDGLYTFDAQIYPNPFDDEINIEFNVTDSHSDTELSLFDILGKKVFSVNLGNLNEGLHNKKINFDNIDSGSYLFMLKNGNNISKKMSVKIK